MAKPQSTKYDDVDWHVGGDFPDDLDAQAARTHIGLFLAWAIERGLESELLRDGSAGPLAELRAGRIKGSQVLEQCCDDKLTNDDLSELGNAFAADYYEKDYLDDYVDLSDDDLPTIYHEPDNAEKYEQVRDMLDARLSAWKRRKGLAS